MERQQPKAFARRMSEFLEILLEIMGGSERPRWPRVFVQGLLLDGDRSSTAPISARIEPAYVQAGGSLLSVS
jgi:SRSO17 transposase